MEQIQYSPLPETKISFDSASRELNVTCPWISLKFRIQPENLDRIEQIVASLRTSQITSEQKMEAAWLLSQVAQFPVVSIVPRTELLPTPSQTRLAKELKEIAGESFSGLVQLIDPTITEQISDSSDWQWDAEEILSASQIDDHSDETSYDPLTIYSLVRRLRLMSETSASSNKGWYSELEKLLRLDEAAFFELAIHGIRQTHYVTEQCVPAITPAVSTFSEAAYEVANFIQEEKGHDRLVLKTLRALKVENLDHIEILPETHLSMSALKFTAASCPLGFACLIGVFEGTSYANKDPMAAILEQSSKPEAAKGMQTHFLINRDHNHSNVGLELAAKLGSVSHDHAVAAIRLAELTVRLGNLLTSKLMDQVERKLREIYGAA